MVVGHRTMTPGVGGSNPSCPATGIAQLGERHPHRVEVGGSSPPPCTKENDFIVIVFQDRMA